MQAYFGERAYRDQACAILGSNSEKGWGETKKRPSGAGVGVRVGVTNLLDRALSVNTQKTPALQAMKMLDRQTEVNG